MLSCLKITNRYGNSGIRPQLKFESTETKGYPFYFTAGQNMRNLLTVISLIAAMLCFSPQVRAEKPTPGYCQQLLQQFLHGDAEAENQLRHTPEAIPLMEDYLLQDKQASCEDLKPLFAQLADDDYFVREQASQQLLLKLPACERQLHQALGTTDDLEVRWRLKLLLSIQGEGNLAPLMLKNMYGRHLATIWPEYFARFQANPKDPRALLLFRHTNPNLLLSLTSNKIEPEVRLKYLLSLKYLGVDMFDLDDRLEEFTTSRILEMAAKTYWPIELQAPLKDGQYVWIVRSGSVKGSEAKDVLQISLLRSATYDQLIHFNAWPRWIYLFRFDTPLENTYQGVVISVNHNDDVITRLAQRIPDEMNLAVVRIPRRQQFNWGINLQYAWAKKYYPADLQERVKFRTPTNENSALILTEAKPN